MRLASIYRYPVKGLSPERLTEATLTIDSYFPGDRLFALENGPAGFDPKAPEHQPKIKFLMLMKNAALAALTTHYDEESRTLVISHGGQEAARGNLATPEGRAEIERFLSHHVDPAEIRGPVKLLEAPPGFRFTDSRSGFVSLVNLASVAEIEKVDGATIDPLRFRANLYFDGAPAWDEASWPGRKITIGDVSLDILKMTDRCAATGVDPRRGVRDMDIPQIMRKAFGHIDCGVYARVSTSGNIREGDSITLN